MPVMDSMCLLNPTGAIRDPFWQFSLRVAYQRLLTTGDKQAMSLWKTWAELPSAAAWASLSDGEVDYSRLPRESHPLLPILCPLDNSDEDARSMGLPFLDPTTKLPIIKLLLLPSFVHFAGVVHLVQWSTAHLEDQQVVECHQQPFLSYEEEYNRKCSRDPIRMAVPTYESLGSPPKKPHVSFSPGVQGCSSNGARFGQQLASSTADLTTLPSPGTQIFLQSIGGKESEPMG